VLKKKIWANFQRIIELFTQKIVTKLSKIWLWDPGSRGQKGTGSRIRIRNTAHRDYYLPMRLVEGGGEVDSILLSCYEDPHPSSKPKPVFYFYLLLCTVMPYQYL